MSAYEILGVSPDVSQGELRRTYQARAQLLHPDRHVGASPEVVAEATRAMSDLNLAWEEVKDPTSRAEYDRSLGNGSLHTTPRKATSNLRSPGPDECVMCGTTPAVTVRLRSQTGKVLLRSVRWIESPLCYNCGIAMFRALTNRTLYAGWWGIIAFFANLAIVVGNLSSRWRLRSANEPHAGRDPSVVTPFRSPMPVGRPLLARFGPYFAAGVIALVLGLVANGGQQGNVNSPPGPQSFLGQCVTSPDGTTVSGFVDCSQSHFAKVVAVVSSASDCPSGTTQTLASTDGSSLLCLDSSQ
jgi:hypothetical protein